MTEHAAFAKLVRTLAPWGDRLVYIGGWAHRLYRLHPTAMVPAYRPLTTLDADVAFAERENLEGSIKDRLLEAGFKEQLTGNHNPPVSQYTLGDDDAGGFYAEFLTPLTGSGRTRQGEPLATVKNAGVTAQRLRYLDLLLESPWRVTLDEDWGAGMPMDLRIPNPVSFIVQKLLVHDQRLPGKKAQDLLYIHDTLELFAAELDGLGTLWRDVLPARLHKNQVRSPVQIKNQLFGQLDDRIRDAAAIPQDRQLDPERMRAMCFAALEELLG